MPAAAPCVAVVVKGYPRLSNTFVERELTGLQARGLRLRLFALRRPGAADNGARAALDTLPAYLPQGLREARRVAAAWRRVRHWPGYLAARRRWLRDLRRDPRPRRLRDWAFACVLAAELPAETERLYAHYLEGPGTVAHYAAEIAGRPWCAFVHADAWAMPAWEVRERLAGAAWAATCTAATRDYLAGFTDEPGKLTLAYHGVEPALAEAPPVARPPRDGARPDDPVVLLSVGRTVAKKGYDVLLDALARLPADLAWRFEHIGGGPLDGRLARWARALGLEGRVAWLGPRPHDEVLTRCRGADLFVLACRTTADGRRDGLPNVLLEAQSQGLACVAAATGGVGELIQDGVTGLLVPPDDASALARALEALIRDPARRASLGRAGRDRVRREFDAADGLAALAARFGLASDSVDRATAATVR